MTVVFYKIDDDLNEIPCCEVTFDGKNVTMEGAKNVVEMLQQGVPFGDGMLLPKDGQAFMEALPEAFSGSRFYAAMKEK